LLKHSRFKWWESKGIIFYLIVNSSENWNDKTVLGFMYKQKLMPWEFLHGNLLKMRTVKSGSLGSPNFATCTGKMYCSCSSLSRLLFQNFTPKKTVCCFFLFMVGRQYYFRKTTRKTKLYWLSSTDWALGQGQCVKWFILFASLHGSLGLRHFTFTVPLSTQGYE